MQEQKGMHKGRGAHIIGIIGLGRMLQNHACLKPRRDLEIQHAKPSLDTVDPDPRTLSTHQNPEPACQIPKVSSKFSLMYYLPHAAVR